MKYSIFETSVRTADYPKKIPVFGVANTILERADPEAFWENRLSFLQSAFQVDGKIADAGDRLLVQNDRQLLSLYKASDSFLYYDHALASPADPKYATELLPDEKARDRAEDWLRKYDLYDSNQLQFAGYGHTIATVGDGSEKDPDPGVKTEVRVHHSFQLGGLPVFGPGAKISNSFVGDQQSRVIHFWRTAKDPDKQREQALRETRVMTPDTMLRKRVLRDPRFAKLEEGKSKVRFHDISLGYYALPPNLVQTLYLPVYQIKGTVETSILDANDIFQKGEVNDGRFRYDFTYYVLAEPNPPADELKRSGLTEMMGNSAIF